MECEQFPDLVPAVASEHTLTILFEDPFWIGLFEKIEGNRLQVCKVTFGAEPTDQEVMEFVDRNWNQLIKSGNTNSKRQKGKRDIEALRPSTK